MLYGEGIESLVAGVPFRMERGFEGNLRRGRGRVEGLFIAVISSIAVSVFLKEIVASDGSREGV